jgi:hypothetical protein
MREKGFNADSADHLPHPYLVISTNVSIVGIQLKKCILTAKRMKIPGFAITAILEVVIFLPRKAMSNIIRQLDSSSDTAFHFII